MKVPRLTAERSLGNAVGTYAQGPQLTGTVALQPMTTPACLSACVGPSAATRCGVQCGADMSCWRTCAGVSDTSCVAACFAN